MSATQVKNHYQDVQIARDYDRARFSSLTGRTFDRLEKQSLLKALRQVRTVIPRPRILDVPCGTGRITELWLKQGLEVLGGDISAAMLEVAREKCAPLRQRVAFACLDLDRLDLLDDSFELVTCIRLFHHLTTTERAPILKELSRVSSRFVIANVSYSSPFYRFRRRAKRFLGQGVSKTSSTWTEIEREADAAKLQVKSAAMVVPWLTEDMIVVFEKSK